MAQIIPFPAQSSTDETAVEASWREYTDFARRQIADPSLAGNVDHCTAMARAFDAWRTLFLGSAA